MGRLYGKGEVIDYVWQYSKYFGNQLGYCVEMYNDDKGHASLLYLLNMTEIIFKNCANSFEDGFFKIIKTLKEENLIEDDEYEFLNNSQYGIRRLRNLLSHANLSKYNIIFLDENEELLYPLTENESCLKLFEVISDIVFNIILKLVSRNFIVEIDVDVHKEIDKVKIEIREITAEKLLEYKGINYKEISVWDSFTESEKYRLAEDASDVNVLTSIFENLFYGKNRGD